MLGKPATTNEIRVQTLLQAARAAWFDMGHMLPRIFTTMLELQQYLRLSAAGHVEIHDRPGFDALYAQIFTPHLQNQIDEADADTGGSPPQARKRAGRSKMLHRWMKLWIPFDARLTITAIQRTDRSLATNAIERADILAAHSGPVFKRKAINHALARSLVKQTQIRYTGPRQLQLTDDQFVKYLKHARHSGCGPDGISYFAL